MMKEKIAEWVSDHLIHVGWALLGQECYCGHNRFNWLARAMGEGRWDDDLNPIGLWTKTRWHISDALINAHNKIRMKFLYH